MSSNKPKLLFVFDHPKEEWWMDGLWAALNVLEEDFVIVKHNLSHRKNFSLSKEDFILGWGGFKSPVDNWVKTMPNKKGLCIGGNAFPPQGADNYDVLFYETKWVRDFLNLKYHPNIVHAFGVNTDIFFNINDMLPSPIVWDYIGVGALADWKRWEKMTEKSGLKLVVGEYQKENAVESQRIATYLLSQNVMVSPQVNPYDLANFYRWSRTLYIPSTVMGGGERAILEARASGLNIEVEDDNPKLKELLEGEVKDHLWYAQQLKKGIMSVL